MIKNKIKKFYEITFMLLAVISVIFAILNIKNVSLFDIKSDNLISKTIDIVFIVEYLIRLIISQNKKSFVRNNIFDLLAIIPYNSFFKMFRFLKLLRFAKLFKLFRVFSITVRFYNRFKKILFLNGTIYLLAFTIVIILISSIIISNTENTTLSDALWWSIVTATTVGYGDISPVTTVGRITAVVLMMLGIGTIGMLTGSISTFFIKDSSDDKHIQKLEAIKKMYDNKIIDENEYRALKNKILDDFIKK